MMQSASSFSSLRLTLRPITTTQERENGLNDHRKNLLLLLLIRRNVHRAFQPITHLHTGRRQLVEYVRYIMLYTPRGPRGMLLRIYPKHFSYATETLSLYWLVVCKPFRFNILSGPSKEKNALLSGSLANTLAGCCKREKVKKSFILLYSLSLFGYSISRVHYSRRVYISKRGKGGCILCCV